MTFRTFFTSEEAGTVQFLFPFLSALVTTCNTSVNKSCLILSPQFFLNPRSCATSRKQRLQYIRLYFLMSPSIEPHLVHFLDPFPYFLFIIFRLTIYSLFFFRLSA